MSPDGRSARPGTGGPERLVYPADWDAALADTDGPQIIVGGPGTGKTEFLARRAAWLLESGIPAQNVQILGFARRGVAALRDRIRSRLDQSIGGVDIATFHSFAARLLELYFDLVGWDRPPQILTGPEQVALVTDLLAAEDPADWSPAYAGMMATRTFAGEVTDFLLRANEQLHAPESIAAMGRADWRGLGQFFSKYSTELRTRSRIDYGTLIAEAVNVLRHPAVPIRRDPSFYILVDEYQDTTRAQVAMLQQLTAGGGHITAAADPDQAIYSFRGATLENVTSFDHDFTGSGHSPRRVTLTTSFRTPAVILDAATRLLTQPVAGRASVIEPAGPGGSVEAHGFGQQVEEAEWIAAEIQRLHLTQQIDYSSIGVFVRSKRRFLGDLSRALERRGVPHELPGSRLSDQPAARLVLDLVAAVDPGRRAEDSATARRRVLLGPRVGLSLGEFRELARQVRSRGSWAAAIANLDPRLRPLAGLLTRSEWATRLPASQGLWDIWSRLPDLESLVNRPDHAAERAAWRSLSQVLGRWQERNPRGTLTDYARLVESEDFEAEPLLSFRRPTGDRLVLTTLHQAKGLELDVVFIADAVAGVFPDLRTHDSLLGLRHLLPYVPTEPAPYRAFRLREEARLAFTAMTRARRRVVWTTAERRTDVGPGRPSRFFRRVTADPTVTTPKRPTVSICDTADEPARNPVTVQEAESALRRCSTDPGRPAPSRLAALRLLADGARWGLRSPELFAGLPERGSDTGLATTMLSPSKAEAYDTCPRRYALERRLGIGPEPGIHASFGSLMHLVLERTEAAALRSGAAHGTLASATDALNELFDSTDFDGEPFATSWRRRATEFLDRLYGSWPSPDGRVIAIEHPLTLDIGGIGWAGRADRIEATPRGLKVVDYKTSRSALTLADAAASLQLGFYAMAVNDDPRLSTLGPVTAAELWYPLARGRSIPVRRLDLGELDSIGDRLEAVARGVLDQDWSPRPGRHCDRCPLIRVCPSWPAGGPAFT